MDINHYIREAMDVRQIISPPFMCWKGSSRHQLADETFTRGLIVDLYKQIEAKIGVEVGVDRGVFAHQILSGVPTLECLHCVDKWESARAEAHYQDAQNRLAGMKVHFVRSSSQEAVTHFEDESIDFVYIDSQRSFDAVALDIIEWGKKVRRGGIISGRGYCEFFDTGVAKAVEAYTYAHDVKNWYITRSMEPSYFWVKQ